MGLNGSDMHFIANIEKYGVLQEVNLGTYDRERIYLTVALWIFLGVAVLIDKKNDAKFTVTREI